MAFYESIYILRPDLTTEQVELINSRVAEIIAANGGKILETELWGRRQLAYPVKKTSKGYYIFHVVEGGGPLVANLESWMRINEDVLKCQNISVRKPKTLPSPLSPIGDRRLDDDGVGSVSSDSTNSDGDGDGNEGEEAAAEINALAEV